MSTPPSTLPPFTTSPITSPFFVSLSSYLQANPSISRLLVSAIVIHTASPLSTPDSPKPRLLLLQRAATDGFPLKWECPGGSVDESDATILHALQRELFEEAGLVVTEVVEQVEETDFEWKGLCRKLSFLVTVGGLPAAALAGEGGRVGTPPVTLSAQEHEDFVWATEDDVRNGTCEGRKLDFAYDSAKRMILGVFMRVGDL